MKLSSIAKTIQAQLHGEDRDLPEISHDTRKIQPGNCFIAIKGENYDGHDFIASAIEMGASVVIASRKPTSSEEKRITFLEVKDTIEALGQIAKLVRLKSKAKIVSLTGSCGKTTVKGMIEAVLSQHGKTLATKGNLNNHIGLPLTLLKLDESYQYAVIEMGANHMGEIAYLCSIACPDIGLITNVRPAHLLGFGTVENVAKAKGEIYAALPDNGTAVVNLEEEFVQQPWQGLIKNRNTITFGLSDKAMIWASDIVLQPTHVQFKVHLPKETAQAEVFIPGKHTVLNALAAISCGYALGVPLQTMLAGLRAFEGVPGRLRRLKGLAGSCIIDDTYNANPGSMKAALEVLALAKGQRLFVMGDMAELGENASNYHQDIGQFAKAKGIDYLFAVGQLSEHAVKAFGQGAQRFESKEELVKNIKTLLSNESTILIKGSRSSKMEIVTNALTVSEG